MRIGFILAAALLTCTAGPALAEPADAAAAVAAPDRTDSMRELDAYRKPAAVLQFLGLEKGDRALDLFGSGGYYGMIMARAVGSQGSVDSWESDNFVIEKTRDNWQTLHRLVPNLQLIVSPAAHIKLPESNYDFVMFNLDYHDLYWQSDEYKFPRMDPRPFVRALYKSMKPGAVLGLIDHVANPGGNTRTVAQTLHRIDPAVVRRDFEAAGFVLEAESPLLRNPADDHNKSVFDPSIRYHTDQIVYRFRKPA
jgi:predicted methyltransferase